MKIWKKFFSSEQGTKSNASELSSIHDRLKRELPLLNEEDHISIACLAGLMARVAFTDLNVDEKELVTMATCIEKTTSYPAEVAKKIAQIASEEIHKLVDHEHHLYTRPLNEIFSREKKEQTLKLLFEVAAADSGVENLESEEIRRISKELRLSHEEFVQAKLSVRQKITALKGG